MGFCCKLFYLGILLTAVFIGYGVKQIVFEEYSIPNLPRDKYWGPGEPVVDSKDIRPFKIQFEKNAIDDLKSRLRNTRYTEPLEGVASSYGFRHTELKKIVKFWSDEYDFTKQQDYMNKYPHFKTKIQGLDLHFIHVKPKLQNQVKVYPLLILHGWPGSFMEFYKLIPLLVEPKKDKDIAFELIIPSLPGFGWSQGASKAGLGAAEIAVVMVNLMERLGHKKFFVQGGDWGSIIGDAMSVMYQDKVLGYHSNMPMSRNIISTLRLLVGAIVPSLFIEPKFEHRVLPLSNILYNTIYESGYFHIQATKPDSVGAGLGDSPAGLAAWILEKMSIATNVKYRERDDAGLLEKFTLTELIDNLMVYWMTNSATTAARIYAESFNIRNLNELRLDKIPTSVPMAAARFPHEINYFTDAQLRDKYPNLIQTTDMVRGGHFAALEEPALLAEDIFSAVELFVEFHAKKFTDKKAKKEL